MGSSTRQTISERAWALARRQHGVVARRQLLELGMEPHSIQHRIERGRLHRIGRGVYAVGRPELSQHGHWMAAVLACGARAALSHESAAALWGIEPARGNDEIEVTVRVSSARERPGICVYRRPSLPHGDLTVRERIPVTTPVRTLIDIARSRDERSLERAVNDADRLDLVDPITLHAKLAEHPGQPGVGSLRALLGDRVFQLTDSELERRFLRLVRAARLPEPLTRQRVNGYLVDFHWPALGLVVETDGLHYHRTPAQQVRDRRRDQAHTAAGTTNLRFTHAQVRYEAEQVREIVAATVDRLRAAVGEEGLARIRGA